MCYSDDSLGGANTVSRPAVAAPPAPDDLIGAVLDDRYLIQSKLGQGGFGAVYLGVDKKVVSRKIVIKVMHSEKLTNDCGTKKFQQEIEALARVNHPSIVGMLDCGETPDARPYIVMQFIDGVSLRTLITPEGMPFYRVAKIIQQVGRALTAAHEAGIIHRDLKPENIMIEAGEDDDHVKVIDFGVAKLKNSVIDLVTSKDIAVGTIAYMSPEQLSAQPLGPESDVYAMAVIAYEMLTGKRPANPESAFQLLELQRSGVRVKPSDLRPSLPREAERVLLKALSFNPQERNERARDFGDLLSSAFLGEKEETLPARKKKAGQPHSQEASFETAHVLFIDIVGYSRLLIDEQTKHLRQLQDFVLTTDECQRAKATDELIALPTGDGMALVFFQDPEAPVRCAIQLASALKTTPDIQLRMGVHSGLISRLQDIKNNMNVAGGGINIAQRVMDCGDQGHILVSKRVADDLGQLARWSPHLHDLGEAQVKHGATLQIFNLFSDEFGNPQVPLKLQKEQPKRSALMKALPIAAAALVLITIGIWVYTRPIGKTTAKNDPVQPTVNAPVGPERSLTYWLTVQRC